jgi:glycosyltransferase involved in cell wall biosynthesis
VPGLEIIEVAETYLKPYIARTKSGKAELYGWNLQNNVEAYSADAFSTVSDFSKHRKYSLVHCHDWLTSSAGSKIHSKLGLPLVQTFHSTEFDRNSYPWEYVLNIEKEAAANADRIIAVSRRMANQVRRLGAGESKIRVVYNGVTSSGFMDNHNPGAKNGKFRRGRKIVLFLGRLTEQKGPVQFLHSAKKVLEQDQNVLFVLAGTGELLPLLINLSIELGIVNNVMFLGYISEEEKRRIYAMSDVYVMPSTSEPFGITALEAMSSGTPVILSKTTGVGEVVKGALRVDFWDINGMAEKILAVLKYDALRKTISPFAQAEASALTWRRTAEDTLRVYQEIALH